MKQKLIQFLLWLAGLLGWKESQSTPRRICTPFVEVAKFVVNQVEGKFLGTSGEFKRAQALRMMLNITGAPERACAKAIEEAVDLCLPR